MGVTTAASASGVAQGRLYLNKLRAMLLVRDNIQNCWLKKRMVLTKQVSQTIGFFELAEVYHPKAGLVKP
jgi:hypothetical protein